MGKRVWVFGGVFGTVGLGMLTAALLTAHAAFSFRSGAESAPGTVVGLEGGKPVVEFVADDGAVHRVVGQVSSNPPAYERGESVTVRCPAGTPDGARIDGVFESWFQPIVLGGLGTVFGGIGGAFVVAEVRKRRLREWLRQFGTRIEAKYTGVMFDTSVRLDGRQPWRLTAQWQDPATGRVHVFESDMLFFDPTDYVQRETVDVWIDPRAPRRYHLDLSFLPEPAG
jgi:hypothetical protein